MWLIHVGYVLTYTLPLQFGININRKISRQTDRQRQCNDDRDICIENENGVYKQHYVL